MGAFGHALADHDLIIRVADPGFCRLVDRPAAAVAGRRLAALFADGVPEGGWQVPPAPGEPAVICEVNNLRLRPADGWTETNWIRVVVACLPPEAGAFPYSVLLEDVTSAKAHQRAQIELGQRYAALLDAGASPLFILLPDGVVADGNRAAAAAVAIPMGALVGRSLPSVGWGREDPRGMAQLLAGLARARQGERATALLRHAAREYALDIQPMADDTGRISLIVVQANDVTGVRGEVAAVYRRLIRRLKRRSRLLEYGFQHIADHLLWFDGDGLILDASPSVAAALGYPADELAGMAFGTIAPEAGADEMAAMFAWSEAGAVRRETAFRCRDGTSIPVEMMVSQFIEDGIPVMCVVARDITNRLRRQRDLDRALERLAATNQELEQLTMISAHELQEPVRSVVGFSQLIRRRVALPPDAAELFGFVEHGARRMHAQLDALVHYLEANERYGGIGEADLSGIVAEILSRMGPRLAEAGCLVKISPLPIVAGNQAGLTVALEALIDNAVHHARRRPVTVTLSAEPTAAAEVTVLVSDDGVGIPEEYQGLIFLPFKRLNPEHGGVGMGLPLARKIAQIHAGDLLVASRPGGGATFRLRLRRPGDWKLMDTSSTS